MRVCVMHQLMPNAASSEVKAYWSITITHSQVVSKEGRLEQVLTEGRYFMQYVGMYVTFIGANIIY